MTSSRTSWSTAGVADSKYLLALRLEHLPRRRWYASFGLAGRRALAEPAPRRGAYFAGRPPGAGRRLRGVSSSARRCSSSSPLVMARSRTEAVCRASARVGTVDVERAGERGQGQPWINNVPTTTARATKMSTSRNGVFVGSRKHGRDRDHTTHTGQDSKVPLRQYASGGLSPGVSWRITPTRRSRRTQQDHGEVHRHATRIARGSPSSESTNPRLRVRLGADEEGTRSPRGTGSSSS